MADESWKEEHRKRAEERISGVESAQERIDALIARAGGPVMVCRNAQESEKDKHDDTIQALFDIGDYKNGGDLTVWIREMTDTIDRMEAALYNVIIERDQLLADIGKIASDMDMNNDEPCKYCKYLRVPGAECWHTDICHWEWRGIPEVTDDDAC